MTLVVIDAQRVFAEPASPWAAPRFAQIVTPVRDLVAAFGAADTVFTRFLAPLEPQGVWRSYYADWPFALTPATDPMWQIADDLADVASTPTVDATTFSKWGPELAARVRDGITLAGVSTDCCVLSTALAAADDGVAVEVVADACAGIDDRGQAAALHVLSLYAPLVRVVLSAEVLTRTGAS